MASTMGLKDFAVVWLDWHALFHHMVIIYLDCLFKGRRKSHKEQGRFTPES